MIKTTTTKPNKRIMVVHLYKVIAAIIITGIAVSSVHAAPTAAEYGVVLNLSGKQRMLTQKMTKEILLVAYGYKKAENLENLAATASLFDKTLKGLADGSAELNLPSTESPRIRRQLGKISSSWDTYYQAVKSVLDSGVVSPDVIKQVAELNLPLLKQMNKAVVLYEKDASRGELKANPKLATAINLSGKQRMLTQKMSKEFLLISLGHDVENNKLNLLETLTLFDRTLKGLKGGDEILGLAETKSEKIRGQLDKVAELWKTFKPAMENASSVDGATLSGDDVAKVASSNLPLLKAMNAAVKMYEQAAQ